MKGFSSISRGHNIIPIIICWVSSFFLMTLFLNYFIGIEGIAITLPLFSYAGIFGIAALSLNLEVGVTGLNNFGKIAFFMVGSYGTALPYLMGYPVFIAIPVGMILAGLMGYLLALPTLNLRQDYLAIVTIAVGEILRTALLAEDWIAWPQEGSASGGALGLSVANIIQSFFPTDIVIGGLVIPAPVIADFIFLIIITILLLLVYVFIEILYNSPWGRILKSIRDNDLAAESLGKDVVTYRIKTFIIASAIAGFAGGIWTFYFISFTPTGFKPELTFYIWIIIILGGLANNRGAILGSVVFWSTEFLTRTLKSDISSFMTQIAALLSPISELPFIPAIQDFIVGGPERPIYIQKILFGVVLILFLIYRPQGVIPEKQIKTVANTVTPLRLPDKESAGIEDTVQE